MDRAVGESPVVEQFVVQADAVGERRLAAADTNGREKEVALVDEPDPEGLGGDVGGPNHEVTLG
jgi:hypothetical protein